MTTTTAYTNVNMSAINTFGDIVNAMNTSAGGYLFYGIDLLIFFTLLISLAGIFGWEAAILTAGFIGIVLGIMFSAMGVMSWTYTAFFIGIVLVIIMYTMWNNRGQ